MADKKEILFIKDVAKYFMDFLESDFHKKNAPKRSIAFRNEKNYLVGVNLKKYDKFTKYIRELINKRFDKETQTTISKGVYYTNIPKDFLDLIDLKLKQITQEHIDQLYQKIDEAVNAGINDHKDELDKAIQHAFRLISESVDEIILSMFFVDLEKPIKNLKLGDENTIYIMQKDLNSIILEEIEEKGKEVIKKRIVGEKADVAEELKICLNIESLRICIQSFFENFKVLDLYEEVDELLRNKMIMDKQDFYLYFCDISYNNVKYPIFYIPFSVTKQSQKLYVSFDSQIYYNKKAIDYIVQEYNLETKNSTTIRTNNERILYVSDEDIVEKIKNQLNEVIDFFKLDNLIDLTSATSQIANSKFCKVTNNCYISIFDKSDESLINDYEEIITKLENEDDELAGGFVKLIDDFIYKDPKKVTFDIRDQRSEKTIGEKLVYKSPIPLNEEQQQILHAVSGDECKYIIVQGPPGTGKSHTITAVIFDQILKNNSVLVLSDKKEALDVVEDKITETLNKVRIHDDFQNPILRLGRTGNTFGSILNPTQINKISDAYFGAKSKEQEIEENGIKISENLSNNIINEAANYSEISLNDIKNYFTLEESLSKTDFIESLQELTEKHDVYLDLIEIRKLSKFLNEVFVNFGGDENTLKILGDLNITLGTINTLDDFSKVVSKFTHAVDRINKRDEKYGSNTLEFLKKFSNINQANFEKFKELTRTYENEKQILFGYLFKKKTFNQIAFDFNTEFGFDFSSNPQSDISKIKSIIQLFSEGRILDELFGKDVDDVKFLYDIYTNADLRRKFEELTNLSVSVRALENFYNSYPVASTALNLSIDDFAALSDNELANIDETTFNNLLEYLRLAYKIRDGFSKVPNYDYNKEKKKIEDIATMQMTQIMDKRFINFYEESKNTALSLKKIIQKKAKFPKEDFVKLKEAFPCIIAGIRDYSEYIPLEPEIFDLVIIDEASQVSIAQAFPALLRAKKILVLGDKKQFSNVKTSLASIKINREYLNNLQESFIENIGNNPSQLIRLDMFNIKSSILDFIEHICNYETMLKKYFRGYKEIISYSNKFFYSNNLQVMKIRGKNIDEVLKFNFIEHDGRQEQKQNTNTQEIEFVLSELEKIKESGVKKSVGIITPHTNQQKAFVDAINKTQYRDYYINNLKLKVMTFDSCQGEERDLIFYSMVATNEDDRLWGVFAKNLNEINEEEEDGKLKAQRLNVGFSRAKESIVFVLSKPISNFNGEIHNTLEHYWNELESAKKEPVTIENDDQSDEEKEFTKYLLDTDIYVNNKDNILIKTQFNIGKYLKQLDATYIHPGYKYDVLFSYTDPTTKKETKIIIEYDGFKENYKNLSKSDIANSESYLKEADIYKQKILEGYGYKFIRLNKFNIGKNPTRTINHRLERLVNENLEDEPDGDFIIDEIKEDIEGLANGRLKKCPECGKIRTLEQFKDPSLKSGMGKICNVCKNEKSGGLFEKRRLRALVEKAQDAEKIKKREKMLSSERCPRCGSPIVFRVSRYGGFYGCSKFPRCRGTKPVVKF